MVLCKFIQKKFAKFKGKHLCRSLFFNNIGHANVYIHFSFYKLFLQSQVFYKVLQKLMGKPMMEFFLSKFVGCNFIMGFFPIILRNFQLFCKILLANGSVPLRHSLGFTSILKTIKVLLLLHSGSFPCAALLKQTLFGLLNK